MSDHPSPTLPQPAPRSGGYQKPLWLIGLALLANAGILLFSHGTGSLLDNAALAQAVSNTPPNTLLGARGIYMMPAQLGPNTFGAYLMDVDSGTISIYKTNPDTNKISLMAARSFKYDRFLEDFNNTSPRPKEVEKLIEDQRQRLELQQKDAQPTVDQTPKPDQNLPDKPAADAPAPPAPNETGK